LACNHCFLSYAISWCTWTWWTLSCLSFSLMHFHVTFSNATPLFPLFGQPSSNDNTHVNSPTSFKKLLFWAFLISCLFFCLQSWKGHMITQGNFSLNGLQNSLGLKMFLPLMGCFTMSNERCAPQLIRSLACLLSNEILWWNVRARRRQRRHKRICWSSMSRRGVVLQEQNL
jgi:hypothetical protein